MLVAAWPRAMPSSTVSPKLDTACHVPRASSLQTALPSVQEKVHPSPHWEGHTLLR